MVARYLCYLNAVSIVALEEGQHGVCVELAEQADVKLADGRLLQQLRMELARLQGHRQLPATCQAPWPQHH